MPKPDRFKNKWKRLWIHSELVHILRRYSSIGLFCPRFSFYIPNNFDTCYLPVFKSHSISILLLSHISRPVIGRHVHEGYLTWPEFSQTGSTVQTGIQQSVYRLWTEVYTFVLVSWLTRIFFLWSLSTTSSRSSPMF